MMRLFIGLGLSKDARDALFAAVSATGIRGQAALRENYHITLAFLGEHDEHLKRLETVVTAAARVCPPFWLTATGFSYFGRRENALFHARLAASPPLNALAAAVRRLLTEAGEPFDEKPFAAHITLMRQADLTAADLRAQAPPVSFPVHRLTLYHSARVQGVLRYRPVFEAPLGKEGDPA